MSNSFRIPTFRLRTLLCAFTLVALVMGGLAERLHRRHAAVELIQSVGGRLGSEYQARESARGLRIMFERWLSTTPLEPPVSRTWWERIAGDRYRTLLLQRPDLSTDLVNAIAALPELRSLDLAGTDLNDRDLGALSGLRQLESLHLNGCGITDESANVLGKFQELRWLEFQHTQLTDASIGQLKRLKKLEVLRIKGTLLTDRAVIELAHLPNLRELSFGGPPTTDAGREEVRRILERRSH